MQNNILQFELNKYTFFLLNAITANKARICWNVISDILYIGSFIQNFYIQTSLKAYIKANIKKETILTNMLTAYSTLKLMFFDNGLGEAL